MGCRTYTISIKLMKINNKCLKIQTNIIYCEKKLYAYNFPFLHLFYVEDFMGITYAFKSTIERNF